MNGTAHCQEEIAPPRETLVDEAARHDSGQIISFLTESLESFCLQGMTEAALAFLMARVLRSSRKSILLIAPTDKAAERLSETISFFLGRGEARLDSPLDRRVWHFPSRTGHKVQWLGKMETTARRLEALYALRSASAPILVVASALALMERLPPPEALMANTEYKVKGEEIDLDSFCRTLVDRGYYRVSLVEEYGDFSRRGSVLDIYSPLYRWPLRLELFGDELESIRMFQPSTQRSMGGLEDAVLLPAGEVVLDAAARERALQAVYEDVKGERLTPTTGNLWIEKIQEGHQLGAFEPVLSVFHERMVLLWDYLAPGSIVVWSDALGARKEMDERTWQQARDWEDNRSPGEWRRPPSELFADPERLNEEARRFRQVWVNALSPESPSTKVFDLGVRTHDELALAVKSHSSKERLLEPLARQFERWRQDGIRSYLVCHQKEQARRLSQLLKDYGVDAMASVLPFGEESYDAPIVKVLAGAVEKGFFWPRERLAVVCEEEIFGRRRSRRQSSKPVAGMFLSSFQDLHVGDFVVHVDHGIGVYKELTHLSLRGIETDFLLIEYQDSDRLYVPVDKLQKVQKYLGIEGEEPRIDKLGGKSWESAKRKARESAERVAEELLELYALRRVREGFQFSPPDPYFNEFEATFTYEETPDQLRAIDDVLDDMASARPMDRLICGDVGYGKTEVALRAAFKAVMDGKQVAMLVPTTVLAEQHFQTFQDRFEGFPIEVAVLSRFKTAAQQKRVVEGLRKGTIDVVVGTHRLLQNDVSFRDLGLLIVDEEHRFGVKHKERLKQLKVSLDVLTLTATPIPRTLHMSLAGIRDLSTIETAPQDRRAIETYVCKYEELTIREAIHRELSRGGQVFFVHNHVQTIYQMAATLNRLVPEARVGVAHGQMKERDLEKVMLEFVHRKTDVLVCTTIIESGIDIPVANTIIINRADRFGLAQIYQLRGRVGRASEQAYAYLLVPGEHLISRDAQKRLRALLDFSELGAGFKIALNDLQIRGGGAILGSSQSGHIAAVGYELYLELIEKTIADLKGEKTEIEAVDPEISLSVSAFLPEDFIPNTDQRLLAYKRLATVSDEAGVEDLTGEWRDRFGSFPESVKNLLLLAGIRLIGRRLGLVRLDGDGESFSLVFSGAGALDALQGLLKENRTEYRLEGDSRLRLEIWGRHMPQRLGRLRRILQELGERVKDTKLIQ